MIAFPPAKINLGLRVLNRRDDGFHNIESLFYPIPYCDILEVIPSPDGRFSFISSGLPIPGDPDDNLVVRSFRLMQPMFALPEVHVHLHKVIPMGSGLGGGSSDAAGTIRLLDRIFNMDLPVEEMKRLSAQTGSDCPFFIESRPAWVTGRGEILEPAGIRLDGYYLCLVVPPVQVSTYVAYSRVTPHESGDSLKDLLKLEVNRWKGLIINDFESPMFSLFPLLKQIKQTLYESGAVYASMTGSGSALFGLFREEPVLVKNQGLFPEGCLIKVLSLQERKVT